MHIVNFFDTYAKVGLKAIALYTNSKIPIGKGWNKNWNQELTRKKFILGSDLNIGLLLGDIVDVEADTSRANEILCKLIGTTPHPMYRSSRSVHHLFISPDPNLTIIKLHGIEFRAKNHQSVLPPSFHEDGSRYKWLKESKFPIPRMPEALINFYYRNKPRLKPGLMKLWCYKCENKKIIHQKRFKLEKIVFSLLDLKWQCHKCRNFDIRRICRKIRKLSPSSITTHGPKIIGKTVVGNKIIRHPEITLLPPIFTPRIPDFEHTSGVIIPHSHNSMAAL